ncbi:hypothetical protein [Oceanicola sp. 502str15]|uniref:hypothetical protein n=1 Tax=Oceanicola sp. 502str15 TaxID=2696061 RepID=UPI002094EEBF|nr:hypothetical protein [Oceanicola sp. 502str15]MCO6383645.1 hypothetical protein [Oceanicola sp. 502str15]
MTIHQTALAVAACLCSLAGQASANTVEVDLAAVQSCGTEKGSSAILCITEALQPCEAVIPETPAVAALCYQKRRAAFEADLPAALDAVAAREGETTGAEARIVVKYEMLTRALLCDRDMELMALRGSKEAEITRAQHRCMALVTGDVWLRLRMTTAP